MRSIPWRTALGPVARIGYKSTELCLRAGWNTEPKLLTRADRAEVRKRGVRPHQGHSGPPPDHKFLLPGELIDYRPCVKLLSGAGYRGPVLVEVSVNVFDVPGYHPVAAAQRVWDRVSPAFA